VFIPSFDTSQCFVGFRYRLGPRDSLGRLKAHLSDERGERHDEGD
jgi:hypothetical protein